MELIEIIATIQTLIGIALLTFSVLAGYSTRRKVSGDLRGKWTLLISFLVFFVSGYCVFLYITVFRVPFEMELVTGSVFLAGAFFVVLVMMVARTTVQRILDKERDLRTYNETLTARTAELEQEIAERIKMEKRLEESEEKYRSLVESTEDSIYVVDREKNYIFMNREHQKRLGLPEGSYLSYSYGDFHSNRQDEWFTDKVDEIFRSGTPSQHEYRSERDGRFFLQTMSPVKNKNGNIIAVSVISKNITRLKNMEKELRILSFTDELTGLYNRRGFFTLAEQQLKIANRLRTGVYLLYVDLDELKVINDTLGHKEGDRALVKFAEILKATCRTSDIIARIGGDEFVVFPVKDSEEGIHIMNNRLMKHVEKNNAEGKETFTLSISTGVSFYDPENPVSLEELLTEADRSMYRQKKNKL